MKIREATHKDVPFIVEMIADDKLGKTREDYCLPLPKEYLTAFQNIDKDQNQALMVMEDKNEIVATMQLSFIQYLTYKGGIRAQIEAVRVRKDKRGLGLGRHLFLWAIDHAKNRNAHVIQLTTDKSRPEAIIFYTDLGFVNSHEGMKLHLS